MLILRSSSADSCPTSQAMRFPMNQHRLELKNAQEARERERELAKEIVDGEMDDDDAPGGDFEGL
jgi:26S proteasome regulatory subunit N3